MTAPNPSSSPTVKREPAASGSGATSGSGSGGFAGAAPPDHRTTALNAAVSILRGGKPAAKTTDVLDMAEEFYQFLKKGNRV